MVKGEVIWGAKGVGTSYSKDPNIIEEESRLVFCLEFNMVL